MADKTGIQWTDSTWNPGVYGCKEVSPGCAHCYAAPQSARLGAMGQVRYAGLTRLTPSGEHVWTGEVRVDDSAPSFTAPLKWGGNRRIFTNSMMDLTHEAVPFEHLDKVFAIMAASPRHTFQMLTKRPERAREYLNDPGTPERVCTAASRLPGGGGVWPGWPLPNVWIGTSVEAQQYLDERLPILLATMAAVRFLSCEPLLGPLEFSNVGGRSDYRQQMGQPAMAGLDWVIVGGESGPQARPFNIGWARSIRDQCRAVGVPMFMKQMGARPAWPLDGTFEECLATGRDLGWRFSDPDGGTYQRDGAGLRVGHYIGLRNSHGSDEDEWPPDLRGCREFPA